MSRETRASHDGEVQNQNSFNTALRSLQDSGPRNLTTNSGTPFTARAHVATKGNHLGEYCIVIDRDGVNRAYIYACCWGHVTNCNRTYIDVYSPHL